MKTLADVAGSGAGCAARRAAELPDFGSPADAALSKSREAQIGRGVMLQLRNAGVVVDDPFLTEYVSTLGSQLATHANNGEFDFDFFVVKDDRINAFALPGGYIGVNSGLDSRERDRERARRRAGARDLARHAAAHRARRVRQSAHQHRVDGRDAGRARARRRLRHVERRDAQASSRARKRWPPSARSTSRARTSTKPIASASSCCRAPASIRTACRAFFEKLGTPLRRVVAIRARDPADAPRHDRTRRRSARSRARSCPRTTHTSSLTYALTKARLIALNAPTPEAAFAAFRDKADSDAPEDRYGLALASMRMSLQRQRRAVVPRSHRRTIRTRWPFASARPKPMAAERRDRSGAQHSMPTRSGCSRATSR